MSVYGGAVQLLPQVQVSLWDQRRLYTFLHVVGRSYACFVRDLCDSISKFRGDYHQHGFLPVVQRSTKDVVRDYCLSRQPLPRSPESLAAQLQLHQYPTKQTVRLPTVPVSAWQYDNLLAFLKLFHQTWPQLMRLVCRTIQIETLDAQALAVHLRPQLDQLVGKLVDVLTEREKLQPKQQEAYHVPQAWFAR